MSLAQVSIVLPTLNEELNVENLVNEISVELGKSISPIVFELIFVDDASSDGTVRKIQELAINHKNIKLIANKVRIGLGSSVLEGIRSASYQKVMVMDADLTHPTSEIIKMLHVAEVYDVVIGSRFCSGGGMESKKNYISSYLYNWILRIILRIQIQDSICGYFCFYKDDFGDLLNSINFRGYGDYFFWFLKGATLKKKSIVEVPVIYRNRKLGESKSNRWKMLFTYTQSAIYCRKYYGKSS